MKEILHGLHDYLRRLRLSGHQDTSDFIARINQESMTGVVTHKEATHDQDNARITLSALTVQPKPPGNWREITRKTSGKRGQ